jgi:hypothetical protein
MNKPIILTTIGLLLAAAPVAAHAAEVDLTLTQQCVQFDGTLLAEGQWEIVWPDKPVPPNGYLMPAEATGTLLNNYPWPCAPIGTVDAPAELVPSVAVEASVAPVAVAVAVRVLTPLEELQAILVANGGW